ncbi:hypothetical protein C8J57DRAFT_1474551 [Mycena rebaudengoi]|nr:hypothetical protein C8J57DRAFT_1474551 [Mycena rebaudengoi]
MAFKGFKFADGFFDIQDNAPVLPTVVPSSSSSAVLNHAPLRTESQYISSNAFPPPVTPRHSLLESASRPTLPALHIPSHFTASLSQTPSSSLRTPDSGYYSAFTSSEPAFTPSSSSFSFLNNSPVSPLEMRGFRPYQPEFPQLIQTVLSDDEDAGDDGDEDDEMHPHIHGPELLLQLYRAGKIKAEAAANNCWRLECNICGSWCATSIPTRLELAIPGQFTNLESHQNGRNCRRPAPRGQSAPADPVLTQEVHSS